MATVKQNDTPDTELVDVFISRESRDDKDVYVAVNGQDFLIKRGEHVKVPKYIAEVLDHSRQMHEDALRYEDMLTGRE